MKKTEIFTMIDDSAPVISRRSRFIAAARSRVWAAHTEVSRWPEWQKDISAASINAPLAEGQVITWMTEGIPEPIKSTVYVAEPEFRTLWAGEAMGIMGIHEWKFTDYEGGTLVETQESWTGKPVNAEPTVMQKLLDASLDKWLIYLEKYTKDSILAENTSATAPEIQSVRANGIDIQVAMMGTGKPVLLLHGWPHTWRIWEPLMLQLASTYRVIAPDLRGIGGTTKTEDGYDVANLAEDGWSVLRALNIPDASVIGIDLGVQIAVMMALKSPHQARHLILMEGLLSGMPGAENFLKNGTPWWFGFHAIPDFAENVLTGNEEAYIDWFLTNGMLDGHHIDPKIREAFISAYSGKDALRCGFKHYRAFIANGKNLKAEFLKSSLIMPTLAIEGGVIGSAISSQLEQVATKLHRLEIKDCSHLIPLEQPAALASSIQDFIG